MERQIKDYKLMNLTLRGEMDDMSMNMVMEMFWQDFKETYKSERHFRKEKKEWEVEQEIFSVPVPYAGIEVPKLFKLGLTTSLDAIASAKLMGKLNITFGLEAKTPGKSEIFLDALHPSRSYMRGFHLDADPIFHVNEASMTFSISAALQATLNFGIEIPKVVELSTYLAIRAPELAIDFQEVFWSRCFPVHDRFSPASPILCELVTES